MTDHSTLYVVATPIGNLADMTPRALQVLAEVDVIAAEDTRRSVQLLRHFNIETRLIAYHEHNEDRQLADLLGRLGRGETVALISDAGTPLISDPGYSLVRAVREDGHHVVPVPGVSSVITALSVAGLPTDRFSFEGFVPSKARAREKFYAGIIRQTQTLVCFETPHRLEASLQALMAQAGPDRQIAICRELTKTYEQVVSGGVAELLQLVKSGEIPQKGEIVLLITGEDHVPESSADTDHLLLELVKELPPSRAAALAARITGLPKRQLYERALELHESAG